MSAFPTKNDVSSFSTKPMIYTRNADNPYEKKQTQEIVRNHRESYKTVENHSNSDIFRTFLYGFLSLSAVSYGYLRFSTIHKSLELVPKN